ncbi:MULTISPECIES: ROK family protein [Rufibacter]|uniref:Glucokinase n=1 Tax=Rufibacter quisquiliarum TaxID=1549639 RepID=A0A839GQY5_9BACT|nr:MULTISPECIES: ROK family protein [Rufibacter]MBA9077286.1 glucokinase [Rufibacter quisquiliarum]
MMKEPIAIAMDLGGTKIKLGLVQGGKVLAMTQMDAYSDQGLRGRLPYIRLTIDSLLEENKLAAPQLGGVGVSIPGIVDSVQKRVLSIDKKFGDAPEIDFTAWAREAWGLPIILENDARAALVGEWQYGNGKGVNNVVLMTLGTGVGTSAVIEGKLLRGKHFQAGILGGHFTINVAGRLCNCGNVGCVEVEAASWSIEDKVKAHPNYTKSLLRVEPKIDFAALFRWAEEKDALAQQLRDESLDVWAACAINLIHAYDPEVLLVGGGIMASGAYIIPYLQEKINQLAWTPWGKVEVKPASSFNSAALLGAGYLVLHQN